MSETDEALLRASQGKDRAAFEELVRRTARLVYARIYLDVGNSHRAEDLVQETFLIAWRSIAQVTDPTGFRPWLLTVAKTVTTDARRRSTRQKRTVPGNGSGAKESSTAVPDPRPDPAQAADQSEQRDRVLEALRHLPPEYRNPLMLRYISGADYATISRQLGLTNGSLRGLLNRGMTRLREAMGADNKRHGP